MATSTKKALAAALKKMMEVKPIDKITIKDLVEVCGVNRQTFYYHFDDVYDLLEWVFEEDANATFPKEIIFDRWKDDVIKWFRYLQDNAVFTLNVYNSNSRRYMLRYIKGRLTECIRGFSEIVSKDGGIDSQDFEFVIEFYANLAVGFLAQWLDLGMQLPKGITEEKILKAMDGSVEHFLDCFRKN